MNIKEFCYLHKLFISQQNRQIFFNMYCIVSSIHLYSALAVHTNQKRFQCKRSREKRAALRHDYFSTLLISRDVNRKPEIRFSVLKPKSGFRFWKPNFEFIFLNFFTYGKLHKDES